MNTQLPRGWDAANERAEAIRAYHRFEQAKQLHEERIARLIFGLLGAITLVAFVWACYR